MSEIIYDASRNHRYNPSYGIFTLALGTCLLVWYVHGIGDAIMGDIRHFPASFRSLPVLTIAGAVFKLVAYVSFGVLFVFMIYTPVRTLWLKRVMSGELKSVSARVTRKNKVVLSIQLGEQLITLPDPGGLESALSHDAAMGDELRFTIGAFSRVVKVEKLS